MTDEQMDARLRRAGEAWRAAHLATAETPATLTEDIHAVTAPPPRKPRHAALLASAAVVVAALVAGGIVLLNGVGHHRTSSSDQGIALEGTVWRLVGRGDATPRTNSLATLYIGKDRRLVLDDGCNLTGVRVDVNGGQIFPAGTFDMRYLDCTDPGGGLTFPDAGDFLTSFPHYSLVGNRLTIGTLHFLAAPELPPPTLDVPTFLGAKWALTRVTASHGEDVPGAGLLPTLQVKAGRLVAADGCNTITADAVVDGHEVDLKRVETSRDPCPSSTESAFGAAVDNVLAGPTLRQQIDGTTLTVKGNGGQLVYRWVPEDSAATAPANVEYRTWQLTSVAGEPAAGRATLRFAGNGQYAGNDGCAELGGTAGVTTGAMTLAGVPSEPSTSCARPARDQAATIDSFLNQKPALWSVRNGKLLIYGGGPQAFSLVFRTDAPPAQPSPTAATDPLVGASWTLTGIATESTNSGSGEGFSNSGITLTFDGQGGFRLDAGCRVWAGDVATGPREAVFSRIRLRYPVGTCQSVPHANQAEALLSGAVQWSVENGQLTLVQGRTTLTFER
jgi:heat shock protein HslJ